MKQARIILKYEYIVDTEILGLPEDVSFEDFLKAVDKDTNNFLVEIEKVTGMIPEEIETDYEGLE